MEEFPISTGVSFWGSEQTFDYLEDKLFGNDTEASEHRIDVVETIQHHMKGRN